jgi:phage I-like protein
MIRIELSAKTAPSEIRLFRFGVNQTRKGPFVFDDESALSVMRNYREHGAKIAFDYDHGSTSRMPVDPALSSKAAGRCDLELRAGELWAVNITWTEAARNAIEAGEWMYVSPTFSALDNRVAQILAVALTNIPATDNPMPLTELSQEAPVEVQETPAVEQTETVVEQVVEELAQPVEVAPESTETAPVELASVEQLEAAEAPVARVVELTGATTEELAYGVIASWRESHEQLSIVRGQLEELRQSHDKLERDVLLEKNASKIPGKLGEWALKQSTETLKAFFESAPEVVPTKHVPQPKVERVVSLSDEENRIAKALGISSDKALAYKQRNI